MKICENLDTHQKLKIWTPIKVAGKQESGGKQKLEEKLMKIWR